MKLLNSSNAFSIIIFFIGISFSCIGCTNDEGDNGILIKSKSKLLVTSEEYKNLSEDIRTFGCQMKLNYLNLSDINKKEVISLLSEIKEGTNSEKKATLLFQKLSSIMKMDIGHYVDRINISADKMRFYNEENDISNKEYVIAINKYSIFPMPRLRNSSENDECNVNCESEYAKCLESGSNNVLCAIDFAACCLNCV